MWFWYTLQFDQIWKIHHVEEQQYYCQLSHIGLIYDHQMVLSRIKDQYFWDNPKAYENLFVKASYIKRIKFDRIVAKFGNFM